MVGRIAAVAAALLCLSAEALAEPGGPSGPGSVGGTQAEVARDGAAQAWPAGQIRPESAPAVSLPDIARTAPVGRPPPAAAKTSSPPHPKDAVPDPVKVSDDPRPAYGPGTFVATVNAVERYREIVEAGGWPVVPNETTRLKPGDRGAAVVALRRRLALSGDLPHLETSPDAFDDATIAGLKRFQARHGLEQTGLVGPRTLVQLNVSASARLLALQASANRLLGSKFAFGERYVAVNIPSATVEAVERGSVARRYVAVVGKPDRPSPTVETRVTSVNFNPTWTVPVSLIRKDIIPHVRKDPGYLARMKIRLFDAAGAEVDPSGVDWSTERAVNYTIRQDAGIENSLGEIRLDMPNRHAVYMHDTPSKRLFARERRAQSSGCVRVSGVKELAGWLLEGTPGPSGAESNWGQAEIHFAIAAGSRLDVRLAKPVPVAWVYLTGYATSDGTVHFRDDVYSLDQPRAAASLPPPIRAAGTMAALPSR